MTRYWFWTALLLLICGPAFAGVDLYVSAKGSDGNAGTRTKPFATLERARDAIRQMKNKGPLPSGGVTVWVGRGTYRMLATLKLTEEDSGSAASPIVYRAMEASQLQPARLHGRFGIEAGSSRYGSGGVVGASIETESGVSVGVGIPVGRRSRGWGGFGAVIRLGGGSGNSRAVEAGEVSLIGGQEVYGFQAVTDPAFLQRLRPEARSKVVRAYLKAQGISDFGEMSSRGFGRPNQPAGLELFYNGRPMDLAAYPNNAWIETTSVPNGPEGGRFGYSDDRPSTWAASDDIWVHGYWTWPWADSYERVKSIDTQAKIIETHPPHGIYGYQEHKRFRFLNVLEELDSPGEWYLDRKTGALYFWPPEPISDGRAIVSVTQDALIVLSGASYVTFRGFTIEACRGDAVQVMGGLTTASQAARFATSATWPSPSIRGPTTVSRAATYTRRVTARSASPAATV